MLCCGVAGGYEGNAWGMIAVLAYNYRELAGDGRRTAIVHQSAACAM